MPIKLLDSHPFPEISVAVLREVSFAANAAGAQWFVGGATARDILTTHRFGIEQSRATADVDIGVSIGNWQGDRALRATLVATGRFEQSEEAQRLNYVVPEIEHRTWLDIVPFGGIEEDGEREIGWPPDGAVRMNVAGFEEALQAALEIELASDLVVLVASLPALAMLKIIAWRDRHTQHARDATDLRFLLAKYAEAGNHGRRKGSPGQDSTSACTHAAQHLEQAHGASQVRGCGEPIRRVQHQDRGDRSGELAARPEGDPEPRVPVLGCPQRSKAQRSSARMRGSRCAAG
ncbi:hypothetical protein DID96_04390 [Burkholderia sp. Bp8963]|uniref:nucleotidyl transferase AbiEii/AbiGii toxin family protein n=1 Tax=Burkholderia sp. Bp8963 TaxID=2184547 RepID=UPI000F5A0103|nr:nucleotidyl transferase AbiEii/AbiGii toxin family protein [Burkholderia sp. Bp8963]RQS75643.1 hypothetical protein DID96_04390 [Burkholderia sp. Bp8963]